jgi:response regulator of citrate/malate metabolism
MKTELDYSKDILKLLGDAKVGMTITEFVNKVPTSRATIRITLAYLLGKGEIDFKYMGMAKAFYMK